MITSRKCSLKRKLIIFFEKTYFNHSFSNPFTKLEIFTVLKSRVLEMLTRRVSETFNTLFLGQNARTTQVIEYSPFFVIVSHPHSSEAEDLLLLAVSTSPQD